MTNWRAALAGIVVAVSVTSVTGGAGGRSYTIDPSRSRATIEVGKTGVLSFAAGHTHEVVAPSIAGTITLDLESPANSSVAVTMAASTLKVSGAGEPADDVPKVQAMMSGPRVLDVQRYPEMAFASSRVALTNRTGNTLQVLVTGRLTLHDVARTITVPVTVRADGDSLVATGRFSVKQTEYGLKPVTVAGVVAVKDTLNVAFTMLAR